MPFWLQINTTFYQLYHSTQLAVYLYMYKMLFYLQRLLNVNVFDLVGQHQSKLKLLLVRMLHWSVLLKVGQCQESSGLNMAASCLIDIHNNLVS